MRINNIGNIQELRIWTLSPLHIGDGTVFDPTAFWIDDSRNELNEFDASTLFENLNKEQKNEILSLCQKADMFSLQKIMKIVNAAKPPSIRKVSISPEIVNNYKRTLSNQNKNEVGKFEIKKTIVEPNTYKAYISGSSLKGAIKTALIADLSKESGRFNDIVNAKFKVSDFISDDEVKTTIGFVDRVSKKIDERKGELKHMTVTMLESINSACAFSGHLSLNEKETENLEQILKAVDAYSISLIDDPEIGSIISLSKNDIEKIKNTFKTKTYLCRLGGYIGAESHTIDGYRDIQIVTQVKPFFKSENKPHTTRLLYSTPTNKKSDSNNTSFGWCLLEVVNENDNTDIEVIKDLISSMQSQQQFISPASQKNIVKPAEMLKKGTIYDAEVIDIPFTVKELKSGLKGALLGAVGLKKGDKIKVKFINERNGKNQFGLLK
ncbi:MAG: type III-A CRISPR-associated RAMP protein Csm5 [Elusimicrobiota bacterium]|jgi:hypothetical protein|nr:type III-A CRISPR-associated RAMP protein Csm5 [Elusimicrobiota bacterium]